MNEEGSGLSAERAEALFARITQRVRSHEAARKQAVTVRAEAGAWHALLPGVEMKVLFDDGATTTWMARMQRGAALPAHDHPGDEEFIVLEGRVRFGTELELGAGDYQHVPTGYHHEECIAMQPSIALIRSPSSMCMFSGKAL